MFRSSRSLDFSGRQVLPWHLSTIPHPKLSAMSLSCGSIDNLDQSRSALFNGNSSLLNPKSFCAVVAKVCLNPAMKRSVTAHVKTSATFSDLPWINRKCGNLRLLNVDCLGKPVEDNFRWCIGSVLHRNHVPVGSQCKWYIDGHRTDVTH